MLDDEHDRFKPGAVGIEQAVIQNRFPGGANGLDLLQATEPAAHAGCHNDKDRLFCGIFHENINSFS